MYMFIIDYFHSYSFALIALNVAHIFSSMFPTLSHNHDQSTKPQITSSCSVSIKPKIKFPLYTSTVHPSPRRAFPGITNWAIQPANQPASQRLTQTTRLWPESPPRHSKIQPRRVNRFPILRRGGLVNPFAFRGMRPMFWRVDCAQRSGGKKFPHVILLPPRSMCDLE